MTRRNPSRPGFTLVEMTMSLAILVLVTGACMSAMMLLSRGNAARSASQASAASVGTSREALDQLTTDLKLATTILNKTNTSVSMRVPDRDGDGAPEVISWSWSGAGSPLKRFYNSATLSTNVVSGVQNFNLNFLDRTVTALQPVESAEQVLRSYEVTPNTRYSVDSKYWESQYFMPTLPSGAIKWKVTKIAIKMQRSSSATTGNLTLKLHRVDSSFKPTGSSLGSTTIDVATVPTSATWVQRDLLVDDLDPSAGLAIVISSSKKSVTGDIWFKTGLTTPVSGLVETWTTDGGASWLGPDTTEALNFRVFGTVTTQP